MDWYSEVRVTEAKDEGGEPTGEYYAFVGVEGLSALMSKQKAEVLAEKIRKVVAEIKA